MHISFTNYTFDPEFKSMYFMFSNLPNGAVIEIAKIANLSITTISKYINGKKVRKSTETQILEAIEKYLKETNERQRQATERIKELLQ